VVYAVGLWEIKKTGVEKGQQQNRSSST